jgi:hypothetical protein
MPELKSSKQEGNTPLKPTTWEVFSICYALEKKTQYESYCTAYPKQAKNSTRKVLDNKASNLMKRGEILVRIDYLKSTLEEKAIEKELYTREQSFKVFDKNIKELSERLEEIRQDPDMSLKDKAYLENAFRKNIKEQEEQKAKLYSLYVDTVKNLYPDGKPADVTTVVVLDRISELLEKADSKKDK